MAATEIAGVIEAVSEAVVFLEPDDLNGLADIHSHLEEVDTWASDHGYERAAHATAALRDILEQIILQEHESPAQGIAVVAKSVSCLQEVVRDGDRDGFIDYPEELGLGRPENGSAPPSDAGTVDASETSHIFKVQLPPYVDEAIFSEFLTRQVGVLEDLETVILDIEQGGSDSALGDLSRHLHTLKGETALLGLNDIERLCHVAEDLLDRENPSEVADRFLALNDWMKRAFDAYAGQGSGPEPPSEMEKILLDGLPRVGEVEASISEPTEMGTPVVPTPEVAPPLHAPSLPERRPRVSWSPRPSPQAPLPVMSNLSPISLRKPLSI